MKKKLALLLDFAVLIFKGGNPHTETLRAIHSALWERMNKPFSVNAIGCTNKDTGASTFLCIIGNGTDRSSPSAAMCMKMLADNALNVHTGSLDLEHFRS